MLFHYDNCVYIYLSRVRNNEHKHIYQNANKQALLNRSFL